MTNVDSKATLMSDDAAASRLIRAVPTGLPEASAVVAAAAIGVTLVDHGGFDGSGAVVAVLALVTVAVAAVRRNGLDRDERWVIGGASLFAGGWIIAAVGWGTGLSGARGLALGALALAFTIVLARRLSSAQARAAARWLVCGSAVVSALALIGFARRAPGWAYPTEGGARAAGTLAYPNAFGLLLVLAVPLVGVQLSRAKAEGERRWGRAAVFLLAASLATTMSRGAAVALVLAVVALEPHVRRRVLLIGAAGAVSALPLVGAATSDAPSLVHAVPVVVGLIAVILAPRLDGRAAIAVAVATAAIFLGGAQSTRLADVAEQRLAGSQLDARSPEWAAAVDQVARAPLLGVGPEQPLVVSDPRDGHQYWSRFAHNELLQVAGGAGLVGLALLGLYGFGVVMLLRRQAGSHAVATALAFAVGGLADFSWHFPAIAMVAGLLLGLNPPESEHT